MADYSIESNLQKSIQDNSKNKLLNANVYKGAMIVWYVFTVLRVLTLFLCTIEKESYKVLLPISQILHMAHMLIS